MASAWKVSAVQAESKQPLVVALDGPLMDGTRTTWRSRTPATERVAGRARLSMARNLDVYSGCAMASRRVQARRPWHLGRPRRAIVWAAASRLRFIRRQDLRLMPGFPSK